MYTNIDPEEGVDTIERYIKTFSHELKKFLPYKLIIKLLRLVMTTSIFQFGNTWWQQIIGTTMGTSCACSYATLFFSYYKGSVICPKYKNYCSKRDTLMILSLYGCMTVPILTHLLTSKQISGHSRNSNGS